MIVIINNQKIGDKSVHNNLNKYEISSVCASIRVHLRVGLSLSTTIALLGNGLLVSRSRKTLPIYRNGVSRCAKQQAIPWICSDFDHRTTEGHFDDYPAVIACWGQINPNLSDSNYTVVRWETRGNVFI